MPEIVLTARRWFRRYPARARAVVVCAVGALALWSFVVVAISFSHGPGASQTALPAVPTTADPAEVAVLPVRVAPRALLRGVTPAVALSLATGEVSDTSPASVASPATPAGSGPSGGADDPDTDLPPEQVGGSGAPGAQPGQPRLSRHLEPGERLVLRALGIAAPALVPVVGGVFETTDAVLDGVGRGLPIRLRASQR